MPKQITQIPFPGDSGSTPTGALQFQNDWPGLFLRGDSTIALLHAIRILKKRLTGDPDLAVINAIGRLEEIAEIIEHDVIVRG